MSWLPEVPEDTMFLDLTGKMIRTGHVIQVVLTFNNAVHGDWAWYRIEKAPGGYKLSYLKSEKGQVLPPGYTGGYMQDSLPEDEEVSLKTLVFTRVPIQVKGWCIVSVPQAEIDALVAGERWSR